MIGYLQEREGVWSATRLVLVMQEVSSLALVAAQVYVAIKGGETAQAIIASLTLANAPVLTGIYGTLGEKRKNDATPEPAP